MAFLLLMGLFAVCCFISFLFYVLDGRDGFLSSMFGMAIFGFLALPILGIYGVYTWLRTGSWGSITVADVLKVLANFGMDVSFFLEPVSWHGTQKLSLEYLEMSIGWTLFFVATALIFTSSAIEDYWRKRPED